MGRPCEKQWTRECRVPANASSLLLQATQRVVCHGACRHLQRVLADARRAGTAVAVVPSYPIEVWSPQLYGHVWGFIYRYWELFVRRGDGLPRALHNRTLNIFLASGRGLRGDLGAGGRLHEEIATLFSNSGTGLHIVRAPWVPFCRCGCCRAAYKSAPDLPLLLVEVTVTANPFPRSGRLTDRDFRSDARSLIATSETLPSDVTMAATDGSSSSCVITWVVAARGVNGRRYSNERVLIERANATARRLRTPVRFELLDYTRMGYASELRLLAQTSVLVSLFGASLHNCRFLPASSVVVQIHAALKNDVGPFPALMYKQLCADRLGLRWVGYAPSAYVPVGSVNGSSIEGFAPKNAYSVARVEASEFERFWVRVLQGEYEALEAEFMRAVRGHRL